MNKTNLDEAEVESVLNSALVCRVALCNEGRPYIRPMNFVYNDGKLYLHTSVNSRKLKIIEENNFICFQVDTDVKLIPNYEDPCRTTMYYKSVIGCGRGYIVSNAEEKRKILNYFTLKYLGKMYECLKKDLDRVCIIKVEIDEVSLKVSR